MAALTSGSQSLCGRALQAGAAPRVAPVPARAAGRRGLSVVAQAAAQDPLMVRAARGEAVERAPCWMMRQVRAAHVHAECIQYWSHAGRSFGSSLELQCN